MDEEEASSGRQTPVRVVKRAWWRLASMMYAGRASAECATKVLWWSWLLLLPETNLEFWLAAYRVAYWPTVRS